MVVLTADSSEGWVETGESLQFISQVPGPRERAHLKSQGGDGDMAQQVKAHAIKPDYLRSSSGLDTVESHRLSILWSSHSCYGS